MDPVPVPGSDPGKDRTGAPGKGAGSPGKRAKGKRGGRTMQQQRTDSGLSTRQWLGVILLAGMPGLNIFYLYKIVFTGEEKCHYRYGRAVADVRYTAWILAARRKFLILCRAW